MSTDAYILLVDDDDICHFLSRRVLAGLEFEGTIVDVADGAEAAKYIQDNGAPLFLLLDLRMPRMDGHEFLTLLDSGELGTPPSVVVATSSARPEDQQLSHKYAFVVSCIEKPVSESALPEFTALVSSG